MLSSSKEEGKEGRKEGFLCAKGGNKAYMEKRWIGT